MGGDATRTRILLAAGDIFAERGFEKATIRDISARADVNLASVNYHFGDKERLYVETIKYVHRSKHERWPTFAWSPETPPETKLREFVRATTAQMLASDEAPWQTRLMMREMVEPSSFCREAVKEFVQPRFSALSAILDELLPAQATASLRHKMAFSVFGQCVFYRFHGAVVRLLVDEDELSASFTHDQIADHVSDLMLAALGRHDLLAG